ncbi:MAG: GNAT family N-acetyltransferase [Actinomycetaceae bacterium]|nr:GNAT family N-acetyltransferase [Actinomycetaceae bacterium]
MNDESVTIRRLTPADLFTVIEAEQAIFPEDAWSDALLTEELNRPDRFYLGAFENDEMVGYVGARLGIDTDLMTVGVYPHARGRGIGRQLVLELLSHVRHVQITSDYQFSFEPVAPPAGVGIIRPIRHVERVLLEVRVSNVAAITLYETLGFRGIGTISDYYRHPLEDALVMEAHLSGSEN